MFCNLKKRSFSINTSDSSLYQRWSFASCSSERAVLCLRACSTFWASSSVQRQYFLHWNPSCFIVLQTRSSCTALLLHWLINYSAT